jgi:hypothetical protein
MPVYFSVPLPGPFRYGARLTGDRSRGRRRRPRGPYWRNRFRRWTYWLGCLWVFEAYYWMGWLAVKGVAWLWRHLEFSN